MCYAIHSQPEKKWKTTPKWKKSMQNEETISDLTRSFAHENELQHFNETMFCVAIF